MPRRVKRDENPRACHRRVCSSVNRRPAVREAVAMARRRAAVPAGNGSSADKEMSDDAASPPGSDRAAGAAGGGPISGAPVCVFVLGGTFAAEVAVHIGRKPVPPASRNSVASIYPLTSTFTCRHLCIVRVRLLWHSSAQVYTQVLWHSSAQGGARKASTLTPVSSSLESRSPTLTSSREVRARP